MRAAALAEQGFLCAYCMRRIGRSYVEGPLDMDIEHWRARSSGADPFHWPDLLGVCRGNPGGEPHCDKSRGDVPLSLHPAHSSQDVESLVRYLGDGTIEFPGFEKDVKALNLNVPYLKANRRAVVDALLTATTAADLTQLHAQLATWEGRDAEDRRREYAGVSAYLLKKRIIHLEGKGRRTRKAR